MRKRIPSKVRISFPLSAFVLAGLIAASPVALAQESGKSDPELPAGQEGKLGPRVGGAAPPPQGEAPKTETIATHGAWAVQCTELPAEQGGKSCGMIQNTKSDKDERVALSIVVSRVKRDGKASTFMRILAPIGVYLPTGIPIEIDGAALPTRMQFSRCLPRMCEGFGEASPETMAKFKKGGSATFYLYDRPGNGYPMKVSLEGFGAALGELDKL
jgi:invasion protein IalB